MQSQPVGNVGMNGTQPQGSPVRLAAPGQAQAFEPGGFWIRFVARFIDGIIVSVIRFPIALVLNLVMVGGSSATQGNQQAQAGVLGAVFVVQLVVSFGITLGFFGWFYRNKGATPGKLLLGLRVVDAQTGTFIGWGQTFMREIVGWIVDGFTLLIGVIIAGFRSDKRALHDMVAGTQVLRVKK